MKSLKPNLLYQLSVSLLHAAAPLITFPYISRVLGPDNIGKINFVDYTAQLLILFASFGIPLYGAREVAKNRNNPPQLQKIVSELIIVHLGVTVISVVAFVLIMMNSPADFSNRGLMILGIVSIAVNAFSLEWFVHGLEDFAFLSKRSFIIKLLTLAGVFAFIRSADDYVIYYLILVSGGVALVFFDVFYVIRKKIKFKKGLQPFRHIKSLSIFFLTTATISIYTYFDTFILGVITGSLAVGFYTTALKVVKLSQNFVNDIGGVILPRISYLFEAKNEHEINRILNKSAQYVLTVSLPLSMFFFLLAPEIIGLIAGSEYIPSILTLQILSLLPLIIGISNIFGIQILLPFGKERNVLIAVATGSILSVGANLLLAPLYEENGAAIACIVAEITVTVLMGFFALRLVKLNISLLYILKILFSCATFIGIVAIARNIFEQGWMVFLFSSFLCAASYFLLQFYLFKNPIVKDILLFAGETIKKIKR